MEELAGLLKSVQGWNDKYDREEISALLKDARILQHQLQTIDGANHAYIFESARGTECFVFNKSPESKVTLIGWAGDTKKGTFTQVLNQCILSRESTTEVLLKKADDFPWPTADQKFHSKKFDEETKQEYKETHKYSSSASKTTAATEGKHGAEVVGFFEFSRSN